MKVKIQDKKGIPHLIFTSKKLEDRQALRLQYCETLDSPMGPRLML
jgi:hypothetical protein